MHLTFTDPAVRRLAASVQNSDVTFSCPDDDRSNLDKMKYIGTQLTREGPPDILADFPYQEVYDAKNGHVALAGQFVCDLRIQFIERAIEDLYDSVPEALLRWKIFNVVWRARFREQVRIHNLAASISWEANRYARPTLH